MSNGGLFSQATRKVVSMAVSRGIQRLAETVRANGGQPLDLEIVALLTGHGRRP